MIGLNEAIVLAVNAHAGQTDKAGEPYILHVLRVMLAQVDIDAMTVAALHDVVEDSSITIADLAEAGWSPRIVDAVDAMTRRDGEDYFDFARRAAANTLARPVKIADLRDNLRQSDDAAAGERRSRYLRALELIGAQP
ncbi:HD domain-containing protein [Camelimonas fluminis]|uniref:HD domain-containing protein n=1 Tax=Camelimonas fluminis TaxID=1576911 RepID=A0ABV7UDF4_9HYPH|nr:HD domain-containing protein [Camelimonas fluminis]